MNIKEAFAVILKDLRKTKKISQEKLALDAELDRSYISLLERQVYQPSLETIFKIAKVLEVPAHEIIKKIEEILEKE